MYDLYLSVISDRSKVRDHSLTSSSLAMAPSHIIFWNLNDSIQLQTLFNKNILWMALFIQFSLFQFNQLNCIALIAQIASA